MHGVKAYKGGSGGRGCRGVSVRFELYYDTKKKPMDVPANHGFDKVLVLLKKQGIDYKVIDTGKLSDTEIQEKYIEACTPSVYKKYRIRQVFGSRRHSGWLFGSDVPALLVYEGTRQYPADVFPHEELGRIITIKEYLDNL